MRLTTPEPTVGWNNSRSPPGGSDECRCTCSYRRRRDGRLRVGVRPGRRLRVVRSTCVACERGGRSHLRRRRLGRPPRPSLTRPAMRMKDTRAWLRALPANVALGVSPRAALMPKSHGQVLVVGLTIEGPTVLQRRWACRFLYPHFQGGVPISVKAIEDQCRVFGRNGTVQIDLRRRYACLCGHQSRDLGGLKTFREWEQWPRVAPTRRSTPSDRRAGHRMLLWCQGRVDQLSVEAAGDVAFERAHGFSVGLALADSALQIGA